MSLMLVSYDNEKGFASFTTSLKKLKEIPRVTAEVKNGFNSLFSKIGSTEKLSGWIGQFDELADSCGTTDKNFISFLETTQKSGIVYNNATDALAGYQSYLQSTAKATTLADLKTKALSVSMQLLSTIGWMAAITAATWAIGKLIGSINDAIHASEIAREKSSELTEAWNSENTSIEKYPVKPISI